MYTLEVDFDVYKAIFSRRSNESVTENDVLRELLDLGEEVKEPQQLQTLQSHLPLETRDNWLTKGVSFPAGTEFRSTYKGQLYTGRVQAGALVVNDKRFESPSSAAVAITESSVNGWRFWECKMPGKSTWQLIESLRPVKP